MFQVFISRRPQDLTRNGLLEITRRPFGGRAQDFSQLGSPIGAEHHALAPEMILILRSRVFAEKPHPAVANNVCHWNLLRFRRVLRAEPALRRRPAEEFIASRMIMTRNAAAEQRREPRGSHSFTRMLDVPIRLQSPGWSRHNGDHSPPASPLYFTLLYPARTRSDRHATITTGQGSCMRTCADAQ